MVNLFKYLKGDRVIWVVALFLALISLVAVYSSVGYLAYRNRGGNHSYYLIKQFMLLASGFAIMYYAHKLKFRYYSKLSNLALWVSGGLLIMTFLIGLNLNSASRWLVIPVINQNFQPSDLAKLALVIYVAKMLTKNKAQLHDFKEGVIPILIPVALICGLILPANFSTAAMLFVICLALMFIGGVPFKHLLKIIGMGIAGFAMLILVGKATPGFLPRLDTWTSRIESFWDSEEVDVDATYQADEAKKAIASGSFFGKGAGHGVSRNSMPEAWSDMIFAFIIEEFGSVFGGVGIVLLFSILFFRGIRIAKKCPKDFGSLVVIGLSFSLVFQAFVNMGVATGIFPVTGQTLPLISMGGTSTWFTCLSLGIILSVSRSVYTENETDQKEGNYEVA